MSENALLDKCAQPLRKHAYSNILKILPPKIWKFQIKNSDIFHIFAQNIVCGYSLEPPRRGNTEHTDSDSAADRSILSDIRSVVDPETDSVKNLEMSNTPGAKMAQDPDITLNGSQSILHDDNGVPTFVNSGPGLMPPHGQPLTPQQMQMHQLINMQAHMQQTIVLSQPSFSEEDVIRLATWMKQLLRDEIDVLLEHKVALRVAPLQDEVDSLKRTWNGAKETKHYENIPMKNCRKFHLQNQKKIR